IYMIGYTWVSILSIYLFMYFLVPRYLQKKKYLRFIIASLFIDVINFIACFFISVLIFTIFKTLLEGEESLYAPTGYNYVSSRSTQTPDFSIPSYSTVDAAVMCSIK